MVDAANGRQGLQDRNEDRDGQGRGREVKIRLVEDTTQSREEERCSGDLGWQIGAKKK